MCFRLLSSVERFLQPIKAYYFGRQFLIGIFATTHHDQSINDELRTETFSIAYALDSKS